MNDIVENMFIKELNEGELSNKIDTETYNKWINTSNRLKELLDKETYKLVTELENLLSDDAAMDVERAYRVGFKQGLKVMNDISKVVYTEQ